MTQPPAVDDTPPVYDDIEPDEEWLEDEPEEAPPRPRRKLLSPLPMTLLVVLLIVGGFFAGVEVEKGQSSSGSTGGVPAGLAALRSAAAGEHRKAQAACRRASPAQAAAEFPAPASRPAA